MAITEGIKSLLKTVLFHLPVNRLLIPRHTSNLYDTILKLTKKLLPYEAGKRFGDNGFKHGDGRGRKR